MGYSFNIWFKSGSGPEALVPYPPFGLVTITVLIIGAFFMLSGIYNSAGPCFS